MKLWLTRPGAGGCAAAVDRITTRVLVDMNLSPEWIPVLRSYGWDAVHWSAVGDPRARDAEIMGMGTCGRICGVHT